MEAFIISMLTGMAEHMLVKVMLVAGKILAKSTTNTIDDAIINTLIDKAKEAGIIDEKEIEKICL